MLDGDLYLVGAGDPTFGTAATIASRYAGVGAKVEDLRDRIAASGVTRIDGRVVGDASRFDNDRGPSNGESALTFDRGVRASPELYAAEQLTLALEAHGIDVTGAASIGTAPAGATLVAAVESPTIAELVKLMNKPSDNFFAEMLLRNLPAASGELGTTVAGSLKSEAVALGLGAELDQVDGSGLNSGNAAAPAQVVRLLDAMRAQPASPAFVDSLPIAGVDGTLADRMRDTPAMQHCQAKTGTLSSVSALSGYCRHPGGHLVLFSVLMNRLTNLTAARDAQDRMASAIASYSTATVDEVVDSVSAPATAAATVPATLSLTLGAPANFGTFVPGVARSYETATTANAVSTAADAALRRDRPRRHCARAPDQRDRGLAAAARGARRRWCLDAGRRRRHTVAEHRRAGVQRRDHDRLPPVHRRHDGAAYRPLREGAALHAVHDIAVSAHVTAWRGGGASSRSRRRPACCTSGVSGCG